MTETYIPRPDLHLDEQGLEVIHQLLLSATTGSTDYRVGTVDTEPLDSTAIPWSTDFPRRLLLPGLLQWARQARLLRAELESLEQRIAMLAEQTESTDTEVTPHHLAEFRVGPPTGLSRILTRQSDIRRRALEIQQEYGDPIQSLAEMLGNIPGSQEDWNALVDEPY